MFNKDGFEKLGEDIYVYHNFATDEECDEIVRLAEGLLEESWKGNPSPTEHKVNGINTDTLPAIQKRIQSRLDSGIDLHINNGVVRMLKGSSWGLHSDNHDFLEIRESSKRLKDEDDFDLAKNNVMGIILYFNDFEGACLNYPDQDITYQPQKGDLVIHSSEEHCKHRVTELISEVRYSHSNNLFEYIKVPKGL